MNPSSAMAKGPADETLARADRGVLATGGRGRGGQLVFLLGRHADQGAAGDLCLDAAGRRRIPA